MMNELDAILGSHLVTTVFLCGSAVLLIAAMIAVTYLCEVRRASAQRHEGGVLRVAEHRN